MVNYKFYKESWSSLANADFLGLHACSESESIEARNSRAANFFENEVNNGNLLISLKACLL